MFKITLLLFCLYAQSFSYFEPDCTNFVVIASCPNEKLKCSNPFRSAFYAIFSCKEDSCPRGYQCCDDSCFPFRVCKEVEYQNRCDAETSLTSEIEENCPVDSVRCKKPIFWKNYGFFSCEEKSCPRGYKCCNDSCFAFKVCKDIEYVDAVSRSTTKSAEGEYDDRSMTSTTSKNDEHDIEYEDNDSETTSTIISTTAASDDEYDNDANSTTISENDKDSEEEEVFTTPMAKITTTVASNDEYDNDDDDSTNSTTIPENDKDSEKDYNDDNNEESGNGADDDDTRDDIPS